MMGFNSERLARETADSLREGLTREAAMMMMRADDAIAIKAPESLREVLMQAHSEAVGARIKLEMIVGRPSSEAQSAGTATPIGQLAAMALSEIMATAALIQQVSEMLGGSLQ